MFVFTNRSRHVDVDMKLAAGTTPFFENRTTLKYMGSSIETVTFQLYEILKIDPEFLQFFLMVSKI